MSTPSLVSEQVKSELASVLDELVVSKLKDPNELEWRNTTTGALTNIEKNSNDLVELCNEELNKLSSNVNTLCANQRANQTVLRKIVTEQTNNLTTLQANLSAVSESISADTKEQKENLVALQESLSGITSTQSEYFGQLKEQLQNFSDGNTTDLQTLAQSLTELQAKQQLSQSTLSEVITLTQGIVANQEKNAAALNELGQSLSASRQQTQAISSAVLSIKKWLIAVLGLCSLSTAIAIAILLITIF